MPASPIVQVLAKPGRWYLARAFASRYRGTAFDAHLAEAAELKALDSNMDAEEVRACHRLAAHARQQASRKKDVPA